MKGMWTRQLLVTMKAGFGIYAPIYIVSTLALRRKRYINNYKKKSRKKGKGKSLMDVLKRLLEEIIINNIVYH